MFKVGQRVRRKEEWLNHFFWRDNCPTNQLSGIFVVKDFTHSTLFLEGSNKGFASKCFDPVVQDVDLSSYM